jgi:tetratricopeptide (TPR) repeat protein
MKAWITMAALALGSFTVHAQETASLSPADPEELFHQGEAAYRNGGYAKAIDLFSQVLAMDPDHLNAYLQRGFCHSLQREYDLAVADFSNVLKRKPDHLWAYTSRGSAYAKMGRNADAMADFNKVIALDPDNQEAFNNRGWTKKTLGDADGACNDWRASRKLGNEEAKIILKNNHCR